MICCNNTVFNVYLRKLSWNRGKSSSTALVLDIFYVKYCAVLENLPQFRTKFHFYAISCDHKSVLNYLSISILSSVQLVFNCTMLKFWTIIISTFDELQYTTFCTTFIFSFLLFQSLKEKRGSEKKWQLQKITDLNSSIFQRNTTTTPNFFL